MLTPAPGSRQALPHCLCPLSRPAQNYPPVAFPTRNPLAIKEFEQWDSIFSGNTRKIFELCHVDRSLGLMPVTEFV